MSLIRFNGTEKNIDVTLSIVSGRVKIIFQSEDDVPEESILLSGFKELNEHNYIEQSDFSDMIYVYLTSLEDLSYILTNDETDIYIEPDNTSDNKVNEEISGDFIFEDYPSYIPALEDIRIGKIMELSYICNLRIIQGVDLLIDGELEHFSYAEEDQTNIKELFDLALKTNVPMYYHADGNSCKLYTTEQIVELYTTATMNKMHHITYFNQLKMYIGTLDDCDVIQDIEYGYELTGTYLETYNAAINQAKIGMKTLLKENNIGE